MISLNKYYRQAALFPFTLITVVGIISGVTHDILGIGKDYKSEWVISDGFWLSVFATILFSAFICLLTTPLFLNKYAQVKNNFVLSLLTWLLPPMICIGYTLIQHLLYATKYLDKFGFESIFVLAVTLPHLIALCLTFIKFRKQF